MNNGLYVLLVNYGEYAVVLFGDQGLYILTNKTNEEASVLFTKKFKNIFK